MKRVLLVVPSAVPGGAERALLGVARTLPDEGWEPTVALLHDGLLAEWLRDNGIDPVVLDAGRTRELARTGRTIAALAGLARDADVVFSNMAKGHFYGGLAAVRARVPAAWWQHVTPHTSRIERAAALVPARAIACVSRAGMKEQRSITPGTRLELVHPGVPLAQLREARGTGKALRAELGVGSGPLIGMVARLQRGKGHEAFLHAAASIVRSRPEARFVVVGGAVLGWEGTYPETLTQLAGDLGLADRVTFAGHRRDAWRWIDALDVLALPSETEGFPVVLVEALALGTPVVATSVGGVPELVTDGEDGLLVAPGDQKALTSAIEALLDNPAHAAEIAEAGRSRAAHFGEEQSAGRLALLLDSLVGAVSRVAAH